MRRWLVALTLAGVLAGCSSGKSLPTPSAAVLTAIKTTLASVSVLENVSAVTPTASGQSTSAAYGSFSFGKGQGNFYVTTDSVVGKVNSVVSGSTLYILVPPSLANLIPKGKFWVSVDLTSPPALPGFGNVVALAGVTDPNLFLAAVQESLVSATRAEKGTTQGIATTHYEVKVDLSHASTPEAGTTRTLLGSPTQTDDLYVGTNNQLIKAVVKVPLAGNAVETLTVVYSGYGGAVTVAVPQPAQTVSAASLLG